MSAIYNLQYPGDSPEKKIARTWAYDQVTQWNGIHIVIPSQYCGDIKELHRRRVSSKKIWCADLKDPEACRRASQLGCARVLHSDIIDLVGEAVRKKTPISSINIDLCNGIQNASDSLFFCLQLLTNYKCSTTVMLTFKRGRVDQMHGDAERASYLNTKLWPFNIELIDERRHFYNYQSRGNQQATTGSPMTLLVLQVTKHSIKIMKGNKNG